MTERELEEYRSLRATILQRGSVRTCVFVGGLAAWGLGAVACSFAALPLLTLIPLLLLAGTFEQLDGTDTKCTMADTAADADTVLGIINDPDVVVGRFDARSRTIAAFAAPDRQRAAGTDPPQQVGRDFVEEAAALIVL